MWSCPPSSRIPSPSRHSGSPTRHSGASRNLWRTVIFTVIPPPPPVIPPPPAVIPACAGIYGVRSYSPSSRIPSPSRHSGSPTRHSGASRNLWRTVMFTVIPALPRRHSGASPNLCLPAPLTVIPAQAGIYACRLPQPSSRRKPESILAASPSRHSASPSRHSGKSRNLRLPPPPAVIPAQAGITVVWASQC